MSNKRKARPRRKVLTHIDPDSPVAKIAEATGEHPMDVMAAFVTLANAGVDFDEVWQMARDAIDDREKIVDAAARKLGTLA